MTPRIRANEEDENIPLSRAVIADKGKSRNIRASCRLPGNPVATDKNRPQESTTPCTR